MRSSVAALSALALLLASCNYIDQAKSEKPRGSCEKSEKDTYIGSARTCTDAFTRLQLRQCTGTSEKKSDKACVVDKAMAGCKREDKTEWYFNDADGYATVESVGKYCVDIAKGATILPTGAPVAVKNEAGRNEDEAKKYLAENGAKAKTSLATIATIATKLPAPTGKVNLEGLKGDVLVVHREDIADPEKPKKLDYRLKNGNRLAECSRALAGRRLKNDPPYALQYCAKNPVLAVLSVTSYAPATTTGTSTSGNRKTIYVKPATISGDVLLFRLDTGKYLGSFGFMTEKGGDAPRTASTRSSSKASPGRSFPASSPSSRTSAPRSTSTSREASGAAPPPRDRSSYFGPRARFLIGSVAP